MAFNTVNIYQKFSDGVPAYKIGRNEQPNSIYVSKSYLFDSIYYLHVAPQRLSQVKIACFNLDSRKNFYLATFV